MLEKDDTGAALLMLGKLILFIGMFVLLYAGNKRGRGWYTLSEPLYKKPYLCRWKWLMLTAFIFTALENNWMNMNDDGEIDSISYVCIIDGAGRNTCIYFDAGNSGKKSGSIEI